MTEEIYCPECDGEGIIWKSLHGGNDPETWPVTCLRCDGTGRVDAPKEEEEE